MSSSAYFAGLLRALGQQHDLVLPGPASRAARLLVSPAFHRDVVLTWRLDHGSASVEAVVSHDARIAVLAELGLRGFAAPEQIEYIEDIVETSSGAFEALWNRLVALPVSPEIRNTRGRDGCQGRIELSSPGQYRSCEFDTVAITLPCLVVRDVLSATRSLAWSSAIRTALEDAQGYL